MRKPHDLLDEAVKRWNPVKVIVLFSGGNDSVGTAHIAKAWADLRGRDISAAAIDTGLSVDGWRAHTVKAARACGFPLSIEGPHDPHFYKEQVLEHGFPYTRTAHRIMYNRLKERVIRDILRNSKTERKDRVLFVTGIRRHESPERWDLNPLTRTRAACYVNPIIDYTDEMRDQYLADNELPTNPFNQHGLGSGDCQCNWGAFVTLEELKEHSPNLYAKLAPIDAEVYERHGWHYGEVPSKALRQAKKGQAILPGMSPFLCAGCERLDAER